MHRGDDDQTPDEALAGRLGRRGVLVAGGLLLTASALETTHTGRQILAAMADPFAEDRRATGVRVERIRRPEDQLVLDMVLIDLAVIDQRGSSYLTPAGSGTGYLAFVLPGQSVGEAVSHATAGVAANQAYVGSELAQPSILAFTVPAGKKIAFDLPALLDWTGLSPVWQSASGRPASVIEAPYRFLMHPHPSLEWEHDTEPRALTGPDAVTTELWHTRLETAKDAEGGPVEGAATQRLLQVDDTLATTLDLAVDATDRANIRKQAKTFITSGKTAPIVADQFILSSLGATMSLHGRWPSADQLLSWDHRTQWGRDAYVKTVNRGFLAPWGHEAVLVEETWRRMKAVGSSQASIAVLQKRITLIVVAPVVDTEVAFARTNGSTIGGSQFPFRQVRALTRMSPPLRAREIAGIKNQGGVPIVDDGTAQPLRMQFLGYDWEGRESTFSSVVSFVPGGVKANKALCEKWNTEEAAFRTVSFGGQQIAVAPLAKTLGAPGSTTLALGVAPTEVRWIPTEKQKSVALRAPFRPVLTELTVTVPALTALTGNGTAVHVWPASYVADQANKGGVVLQPKKPIAAPVPGETTGGLAALPAAYQGFSNKVGAVLATTTKALDQLAAGVQKAEQIYGDLMLLGQLPLAEIIDDAVGAIPQAVTTVLEGRQTVTTTMTPALHQAVLGPIAFVPGKLAMVATAAAGGGKPAEHTLDARLSDATLQLAGLVKVPITELRVTSTTAAPFDLTLTLGKVEFLGALAFVQTLAEILGPLLQENRPSASSTAARALPGARRGGPDVDVDVTGLHLSQAIAVPDVAVGVFNLSGLNFGLGIDLAFTGGLTTRFNFATHESPFQVTYGPFGGGGYCALELSGGDVSRLEVSLMVAGGVGINLGVAAGAISVSAGLVLVLPEGKPLSLTAFFRASGALEVLGLVSVSVVFEIALTYAPTDPVTLVGSATLAMKVEVCWVSKTVKATVNKTFSGGQQGTPVPGSSARAVAAKGVPDDQTFAFEDTYPDESLWAQYAAAFA